MKKQILKITALLVLIAASFSSCVVRRDHGYDHHDDHDHHYEEVHHY